MMKFLLFTMMGLSPIMALMLSMGGGNNMMMLLVLMMSGGLGNGSGGALGSTMGTSLASNSMLLPLLLMSGTGQRRRSYRRPRSQTVYVRRR